MSVPRPLLLAVLVSLAAVLGAFLWRDRTRPEPSPSPLPGPAMAITIENWVYRDGEVSRTEDGGYVSSTGLAIEQAGLSVEFEPGSTFHFEGGLPVLERGTMDVRATAETDYGPYRIPEGGDLTFGQDEITVGTRGVLVDGFVVPPGTIIERTDRDPRADPPAPDRSARAAGIVVDAANGEPIAGARVRITHGDTLVAHPPLDVPGAIVATTTDRTGRFRIDPFLPEDPRVRIRVEVDAPGYRPVVRLVDEPCTLDGVWPYLTLALRRAWLTELRFLDLEQRPVEGMVRVTTPADPYVPEEGPPLTREGDVEVAFRTVGDDGTVSALLPRDEVVWTDPTTVPYPEWLPWPSWAGDRDEDGVDATGRPVPIVRIIVAATEFATFELVDAAGFPVAAAALEVTVPEESRSFRLRTDSAGRFTFGVADRDPVEPSLAELPKGVTLRVLDTAHRDQTHSLFVPGHPDRLFLEGLAAPELRFRLVHSDPTGEELVPIPAEQVRLSRDLTVVRAGVDGRVVARGPLPPPGERFIVACRDVAPIEVTIPGRTREVEVLDLGDLVVPRREPTLVRLPGVPAPDLEGAVLEIAGDELMDTLARYPLGESARLEVGGLDPFRFHRFRIDGPWIHSSSGEFRLADDERDEGLVIPQFASVPDRTLTTGRAVDLPPWETARYRVIERLYRGDERDPMIRRSYPLAPDGRFGSLDEVVDAVRFEAVVVSDDALFAHAPPRGFGDDRFVPHGTITAVPPRRGRFHFRIRDAGPTLPPDAELTAYQDRDEELTTSTVRFPERGTPYLEVRSLLVGEYALQWGEPGLDDGVAPLVVTEERRTIDTVVDLDPAALNAVLVTVVDPDGAPVIGAAVHVSSLDEDGTEGEIRPGEEIAPGLYRIQTLLAAANRIRVVPGQASVVPLEVTVPAGGAIDAPLALVASAGLVAEVRDPGERRIDGIIRVEARREPAGEGWPEGTTLRHGATVRVALERGGTLTASGLPSGPRTLTFRHEGTEHSVDLVLDLRKGPNEAPEIILEERRTLRGTVVLDRGDAAAGARVQLIDPAAADTYPGRQLDPSRVRRSTTAAAGGDFEMSLDGIGRGEVLALVATLPGRTPAVLSPVILDGEIAADLAGAPITMILREGNELVIAPVRTGTGTDPMQDRFRLVFDPPGPDEAEVDLGAALVREPTLYTDVRPGTYRLEWGPASLPDSIVRPTAEVELRAGTRRTLQLVVDVDFRDATAVLNGRGLAHGWALVTDDPADPARLRAAPVRDGRTVLPLHDLRGPVMVALVPEDDIALFDPAAGVALPWPLRSGALESDPIPVATVAHDLIFRLGEGVWTDPDAWIVLPRWRWDGRDWERDGTVEIRADRPEIRVPLLTPGVHPYTVESRRPGGWAIRRSVEIVDEPVTVNVDR